MKQIAKSLVLVGAMVSAGGAAASFLDDICPYAGIGYKQNWTKGKGFWHNKVAKSFPGGEVFIGAKFTENFGAELGYDWTASKKKTGAFGRGRFNNNNVFGFTNFNSNDLRVRTKTRFQAFYLDLMGYLPLDNCWELIGAVGISSMKAKVHARVHQNNRGLVTGFNTFAFNRNDWRHIESSNGKTKAVWRLGAGAQYLFTECVGLRLMGRWEGTEALRRGGRHHHNRNFNNTTAFGNFNGRNFGYVSKKPFKDTFSLALSLFVKF